MNEGGKSDGRVVPVRPVNKAAGAAAESVEGRRPAEGNTASKTRPGRRAGHGAPSALDRVREVARRDKEARFTALLHHVDLDRLRAAYWALSPKAAPGVDGVRWTAWGQDLEANLHDLHRRLHAGRYRARPSRRAYIPKADGRLRPLGIATVTDRVVQAALKLVLEPIFEADFLPCSYGFRPNRRAHDAVGEVRLLTSCSYEWVVEGDIKACFDEISHSALMGRVRHRIGDKRVLALIKAFLKAGILGEDRLRRETSTGTPQGSILSPLLSNVALSVLDEHIAQRPGGPQAGRVERAKRRRHGRPNYQLVRYADDWCLLVHGTRGDAEALREEIAGVLATMGLRLSQEKTLITHIDQGLDFLGWRIQRHRKQGTTRYYVYTYPARKALRAVMDKVKTLCRRTGPDLPLEALLIQLNRILRGWCAYCVPRGCARSLREEVRLVT